MKAMGVISEDGMGDVTTTADKMLLNQIVEWNLDDASGELLPVTVDNLNLLKREDIEVLVKAVGANVDDEQKKSSSSS